MELKTARIGSWGKTSRKSDWNFLIYIIILGSKEWVEKHAPSSFDAIEQCIPQIGSGFESGCCNNPISGLVSMFNKKEQCCDSQGLIQQGQCQDHLMSYRRR